VVPTLLTVALFVVTIFLILIPALEGGLKPSWCRPLSAWQAEVGAWIRTLEAQDLLQAKIFLDHRVGYGDASLLDPLRATLREALEAHPRFLSQLAINVLLFKPPIVDFGRLYALRHGIGAANTLERLGGLLAAGVLTPQNHGKSCRSTAR
jgi:CBS domain-containing protein